MSPSRFSVGTEVLVISLGRANGVVSAITGDGRYRIQVGSLSTICSDEDLAAIDAKRKPRKVSPPPADERAGNHAAGRSNPRVDLHGMTVEEALGVVLKAIDAAIQTGADRLEIVHGKGTGRLKAAVQRELARVTVVRAIKADPHNAGVTWVYF
jgi:DNA mismatch repair protein MutS2